MFDENHATSGKLIDNRAPTTLKRTGLKKFKINLVINRSSVKTFIIILK